VICFDKSYQNKFLGKYFTVKDLFNMIELKCQITCPYCSCNQSIDCSEFADDPIPYNGKDNSMGEQYQYFVECDAYECINCRREFMLKGSFWEYPIGILNDCSVHAESSK
jgi:DNA-directed RNA polymerase subunit RPC12/RpoP